MFYSVERAQVIGSLVRKCKYVYLYIFIYYSQGSMTYCRLTQVMCWASLVLFFYFCLVCRDLGLWCIFWGILIFTLFICLQFFRSYLCQSMCSDVWCLWVRQDTRVSSSASCSSSHCGSAGVSPRDLWSEGFQGWRPHHLWLGYLPECAGC